ncbi:MULTISPECIES: AraC family transcriptional regulator [Variovorax]|jgi:AraC-like DNA-binding protein|uniref:AraC family transcriptional regulator n=1 Tax=Variovorax TaxID=34072 RepID=UPI00086DC59D|nr:MULTISPECIES: helix-turn-helix transcriptional regulator [Variovorax]MBN8752138.1 helix-turn-helix transcriptional regulator [Variovorax sp.]ODU15555.1 MAG: AraC family transcriptional regulator [Variovorax sp. SCN 67-85]ODV16451.1 MAG: AraC family transcriptional regulator [Variovorax sp. SCN 67-20]OJZ09053.1 MAG: AraC family transcriptional regulator [Variovorax sp. 67-131]UKI11522.1 helix-turn-helix transcriptional regulator [Variovorax paradoxus]
MPRKPAPKTDAEGAMPDLSERADGPALIALRGADAPEHEFRLGTREYDWHRHLRGQVFCVESGLVHVRTAHGSWLLPPHRAGWLPPGELHKVGISGATSGWTVLIAPAAAAQLPERPCVIGISELMRALVRRAVTWGGHDTLDAEQERMAAVLLDEMRRAPHEPLHLPMPTDRRLLRIATAIYEQPENNRTLDEWAHWAGLSPRTLSRLFLAETAVSFAKWRQQARLVHALERLARGEAVADIADALGYATPSNFIAMFRRAFGESPGRYFAGRGAQ